MPIATRLGAYVAHFNARDFDAIRAMIADDVRLDLVSKTRMNGKAEVSRYFGNYAKVSDWHLVPGLVEGHPAILVFDPNAPDAGPKYFMLLDWAADKVADHPGFPPRAVRHRRRGISRSEPRRFERSLPSVAAPNCDNCCPSNRHYNSCHPRRLRIMVQAAGV